VIRTVALSAVSVAGALALVAPASSPPTSEPSSGTTDEPPSDAAVPAPGTGEQVEVEGSPEFERKLAELAFALYLGNELDVEPGSSSCTEPSSLDVGESITCFTLIGSERVIVARTELSGTSGVYDFELVSDHQVTSADTTPAASSTTGPSSTTTLPTPVIVTTTGPLTSADRELLAHGEQINEDADALVATLLGEEDSVIASAEYSWDATTTTVVLTVTLGPTYENSASTMAWILSRDRAMDLWDRATPFRAETATIRPGLVVTVDGTRFVSDFDLCVQLADQTIAMRDWIAASLES
jgi:hypothetical protein